MSDAFSKLEERYGLKNPKEESRSNKYKIEDNQSNTKSSKIADQLKQF